MAISIKEIEKESGSKVISEHKCDENELPDFLRVCKVSHSNDIEQWDLFNITVASEIDVKNGEAEVQGELMGFSSIKLNYCPFCGYKLN